jgi:hypothetical protein
MTSSVALEHIDRTGLNRDENGDVSTAELARNLTSSALDPEAAIVGHGQLHARGGEALALKRSVLGYVGSKKPHFYSIQCNKSDATDSIACRCAR